MQVLRTCIYSLTRLSFRQGHLATELTALVRLKVNISSFSFSLPCGLLVFYVYRSFGIGYFLASHKHLDENHHENMSV